MSSAAFAGRRVPDLPGRVGGTADYRPPPTGPGVLRGPRRNGSVHSVPDPWATGRTKGFRVVRMTDPTGAASDEAAVDGQTSGDPGRLSWAARERKRREAARPARTGAPLREAVRQRRSPMPSTRRDPDRESVSSGYYGRETRSPPSCREPPLPVRTFVELVARDAVEEASLPNRRRRVPLDDEDACPSTQKDVLPAPAPGLAASASSSALHRPGPPPAGR
jgi:hypothetical protein